MKIFTIVIVALVVIGILGFAYFYFMQGPAQNVPAYTALPTPSGVGTPTGSVGATPTPAAVSKTTVLGTSAGNRDITAYQYGTGDKELLFVGGIHGGYEWNTVLVAYQLVDYLDVHPDTIPKNLKITVIPVLNPDGLSKVVGKEGRFTSSDVPSAKGATIPGRYNQNGVDLNRNFDCSWQRTAVWQTTKVNPGASAFSEPESQAVKNYVLANKPAAVVVWYSAIGGVFASNCHNGILPETEAITKLYADASGYKAYDSYDFYSTTGDMVNWLAKNNIPGISVLLTNHTDTDWSKNLPGIQALIARYSK